jgi:SAM-dependent methyltransferase
MTFEKSAAYWEKRGLDFKKIHRRLLLIRSMFDMIPRLVASVLDVGCGPAILRELLPRHVEYFGVDFAPAIIEAMNDPEHFEVADLNVDARCFGSRRFDLVICSGIFEYVHDADGFLRFLETKAQPDGYLIFTYTNRQHFRSLPAMLRGQRPTYVDPHYNFVTIPETITLLKKHGFTPLTYKGITHRRQRVIPLLNRCTRFPLSMFNRQFLFLCAYAPAEESRIAPRAGDRPELADRTQPLADRSVPAAALPPRPAGRGGAQRETTSGPPPA